ncbi:hypothetical protein [Arthrobacter sp. NA-172]|uniref:hypothetical protein n=1 Tax=Arthrobacter sp. NA-172 TaxID=3367524 RepID=UPI0037554090
MPTRVPGSRPGDHANDLSIRIWEERGHLGSLLSALEAAAGPTHPFRSGLETPEELQQIRADLQFAGLARDIAAQELAETWNLSDHPTLPDLIHAAPAEPWPLIFSQHLEALEDLVARIDDLWSELGRTPPPAQTTRTQQNAPAKPETPTPGAGETSGTDARVSDDRTIAVPITNALRGFINKPGNDSKMRR